MVENIEKVRGKLHFVALVERGRLSEARVEVPESEAAQRIARAVPSVRADIDGAEVAGNRAWIREEVQACSR